MKINRVACVGVGLIGHSWATLFSLRNLKVYMHDISEETLEKALKRIESNLIFLEKKKIINNGEPKKALNRIKTTTSIDEAVGQSDFIQESVTEDYSTKKMVFKEMDHYSPSHAILASSSSGLLMTEIQKSTERPERCVLAHPILPPHLIPVVEIVGGDQTVQETINETYNFMLRVGKIPVILNKEVPGYIVNRLQAAIWREAISLVANGVANTEDVDRAFSMGVGLRDPLFGPFLRAHVAGGGIEQFIKNYTQSYGNRWRTMETWTSIPNSAIKKVVESVREMEAVRKGTLEEIEEIRDEKLAEILALISPKHPFY
jgi:3-hydroxypropionate dehydrogenase (NADP+)